MSQVAIVEAFKDLPDPCRTTGQRHANSDLFGGNRGLLAIGD